ncbi:MAG: enoyl-CoA hydratase [Actinomycetota bacterium]
MIRVEQSESHSVVTMDRPERRNALNMAQCAGIRDALLAAPDRGDRAVVITGTGGAFSAGADFNEVAGDGFRDALYGMLDAVLTAPIPVIAAINGHAIGAGMQLAIAADLRVVSDNATFAIPTARLGLAVDPWTIERLTSLVGGGPARRILFTCERVTAHDPAVQPMADRRGDLDAAVALAADLATMAPLTLGYIKETVNELSRGRHDSEAAASAFERVWTSDDFREGLASRAEKRTPEFKGR